MKALRMAAWLAPLALSLVACAAQAGGGHPRHTSRTYFGWPGVGPYASADRFKPQKDRTYLILGKRFCRTAEDDYQDLLRRQAIVQARYEADLARLEAESAYLQAMAAQPHHPGGNCNCNDKSIAHAPKWNPLKGFSVFMRGNCGPCNEAGDNGCATCGNGSCANGSCGGCNACKPRTGHSLLFALKSLGRCKGCAYNSGSVGPLGPAVGGYGAGLGGNQPYPAMNREDALRYLEGFQYYPPNHLLRSPRDFFMFEEKYGIGR